jgi:hypothetical protein
MVQGALVHWRASTERIIIPSTAAGEYVALSRGNTTTKYVNDVLKFYGNPPTSYYLYTDNQAAEHIATQPNMNEHSRSIDTRHHAIRQDYIDGHMRIGGVASADNTSDILTKYLQPPLHEKHAQHLHITQDKRPPKTTLTNCVLSFVHSYDPSTNTTSVHKRHRQPTMTPNNTTWELPPAFLALLPQQLTLTKRQTKRQRQQYWNAIHTLRQQNPHLRIMSKPHMTKQTTDYHNHCQPHHPRWHNNPSATIVLQRNASQLSHTNPSPRNRYHRKHKYKLPTIQIHSHQGRINSKIQARVRQHTTQCIQHTKNIQNPRQHHLRAIPHKSPHKFQLHHIKQEQYNPPAKLFSTSLRSSTKNSIHNSSIPTQMQKSKNETIANTSASHAVKPHHTYKNNTTHSRRPREPKRKFQSQKTGKIHNPSFSDQSDNFRVRKNHPIGFPLSCKPENPENVSKYNSQSLQKHDVTPCDISHLPHNLDKIYDVKRLLTRDSAVKRLLTRDSAVKRLLTRDSTVNSLKPVTPHTTDNLSPPTYGRCVPHKTKTNMTRTPPRRSRSTPRHQHNALKFLQAKILRKLNTVQHFIICNNAPISTVSMATYRQQQALLVRTQIHQLMALLDEAPTTFPNHDDFQHYHGIFEFYRSMVYREEIRLDKIIDDLQDYVTYTIEHGIPRPPIHPNPHMIPYSLNDFMAEISDSSSSDDENYVNTA